MKNKISRLQIIIGIVILVVIVVIGGIFAGTKGIGSAVYANTDYGVKFTYPSDWEVIDNSANGFFMISCKYKNSASISMDIQVLDVGNVALSDYTAGFINGTLKKEKILESNDITFANNPGHEIIYEAGSANPDGDGRYMLVYTIKGMKSYVLAFSSGKEDYSSFLPAAENIISSFQITK